MSRVFAFAVCSLVSVATGSLLVASSLAGCSDSDVQTASTSSDAGVVRRDAAPVEPTEPSPQLDAGTGPVPSCRKYCELVMANCTGESAQYESTQQCLAFCAHLPLEQPTREADEKEAASVACRQYWADGPARTRPETYCLAAGPFGGNACGNRCTAFCSVALSACSPDAGGSVPYQTQPECATACAGFTYRDASTDGGGEGPDGPVDGDSLNCRLYWLRAATMDPEKCAAIAPDSEVCK